MAKRNRKPFDPAKQEEQRRRRRAAEDAQMRADCIDPSIARWGDDALDDARVEALQRQGFEVVRADSKAAQDVGRSTVAIDHRGRQIKASHKADIWQQLHARDPDKFTKAMLGAVRDLQDLMAKRAGVGGRDEKMAYARDMADEPFRDPCLVSDQMLEAGREMDLTLSLVGPPSSRLLTALLWPEALNERATTQKPMRRCAAKAERELSAPANGARPGVWDQAVRDFEDRKRGRTKPRTSVERRVCESLNEVDAKHCQACGAPMPEDVKNTKGEIVSRPGVEMLTVDEDWRAVVARVTGEANPMGQSALLRNAAQALVDVKSQVQAAMKQRRSASKRADSMARDRADPQGLSLHPFHNGEEAGA